MIPIAVPKKRASAKVSVEQARGIPFVPARHVEWTRIAQVDNAVCPPTTMAARPPYLSPAAPKKTLASPTAIAVPEVNVPSFALDQMPIGNVDADHVSSADRSSSKAKFMPQKQRIAMIGPNDFRLTRRT